MILLKKKKKVKSILLRVLLLNYLTFFDIFKRNNSEFKLFHNYRIIQRNFESDQNATIVKVTLFLTISRIFNQCFLTRPFIVFYYYFFKFNFF